MLFGSDSRKINLYYTRGNSSTKGNHSFDWEFAGSNRKITAKQYLANYGVKGNMRADLVIHSANEEELIPIAE